MTAAFWCRDDVRKVDLSAIIFRFFNGINLTLQSRPYFFAGPAGSGMGAMSANSLFIRGAFRSYCNYAQGSLQ